MSASNSGDSYSAAGSRSRRIDLRVRVPGNSLALGSGMEVGPRGAAAPVPAVSRHFPTETAAGHQTPRAFTKLLLQSRNPSYVHETPLTFTEPLLRPRNPTYVHETPAATGVSSTCLGFCAGPGVLSGLTRPLAANPILT